MMLITRTLRYAAKLIKNNLAIPAQQEGRVVQRREGEDIERRYDDGILRETRVWGYTERLASRVTCIATKCDPRCHVM